MSSSELKLTSKLKMNIIIFGETGSGKSSLVNLLLGSNVAKISDSAIGCTFQYQKYEMDPYTLYDTVGLGEGSFGTVKSSSAISQLIRLLKSLQDGVCLLIFVMEKGRIRKTLDENYKLFANAICMRKVPVLLAISHCELDERPEKWWEENQPSFTKYGWQVDGVVCGCFLNPETASSLMRPLIATVSEKTKTELLDIIDKTRLDPGWKVEGGFRPWLTAVLGYIFSTLSKILGFLKPSLALPDLGIREGLEKRLYNWFLAQGQEAEVASALSNEIALGVSSPF